MKAKDLMIGDWVSVYIEDDDPAQCGYVTCKVEYINDFGDIGAKCNDYREEDVEPIPLTPEILDKNGFEQHINNLRHPQCSYFELADWSVGWCVHLYPMPNRKYFLETSAHVARTIAKTTTAKVIEYIHELQHAIKYSEIEKEIVL